MKKLELDLNRLDDNELEMYLALKKKMNVPTLKVKVSTKKTRINWKEDLKSLEDFLQEPKLISEM